MIKNYWTYTPGSTNVKVFCFTKKFYYITNSLPIIIVHEVDTAQVNSESQILISTEK